MSLERVFVGDEEGNLAVEKPTTTERKLDAAVNTNNKKNVRDAALLHEQATSFKKNWKTFQVKRLSYN